MKAFLSACVAIVVIGIGAKIALERTQPSSAEAYSIDRSVRLD